MRSHLMSMIIVRNILLLLRISAVVHLKIVTDSDGVGSSGYSTNQKKCFFGLWNILDDGQGDPKPFIFV